MVATILYDGAISGGAIAAAIGSISGSYIIPIVSANGMQVCIIRSER